MARQPVPAFSYRSFNSTRNSALTDLTCSAALSALFCFVYVIPFRSDRRLRSAPPPSRPRGPHWHCPGLYCTLPNASISRLL